MVLGQQVPHVLPDAGSSAGVTPCSCWGPYRDSYGELRASGRKEELKQELMAILVQPQ